MVILQLKMKGGFVGNVILLAEFMQKGKPSQVHCSRFLRLLSRLWKFTGNVILFAALIHAYHFFPAKSGAFPR